MIYISEINTKEPINLTNNTAKKVFETLNKLNIEYEYVENDVVETMEECIEIDKKLGTEIRKSIFLCNKKKTTFFLVVLPANKSLDVNKLEKKIGLAPLSFASSELMEKHLGCLPGSASVMGLINDLDDYVQLIIDKEIVNEEYFGCNPGTNTMHLKIKTSDLLTKFLPKIRHKAKIMEL